MDSCNFSSSSTNHMGKLVGCNIGSTYNWSGCNNGWYCSSTGFLFNHALVANTMAELKYVFPRPFPINREIDIIFLDITAYLFSICKEVVRSENFKIIRY